MRVRREASLKQATSLNGWLALQQSNYASGMHIIQWLSFFFFFFCHLQMEITCYDTWPYYNYCFKILILRKPNSVSKATVGYRHGLYETGQRAPVLSGMNVVHLFKIRIFYCKISHALQVATMGHGQCEHLGCVLISFRGEKITVRICIYQYINVYSYATYVRVLFMNICKL